MSLGVERLCHDWSNDDNLEKWRGVFIQSLEKVLRQVHPTLTAQEEALKYAEEFIVRLLVRLIARPSPTSVADIEERVSKTFPFPIDKWAITEAQSAVEKGRKKAQLVLPTDKVHSMLKEVLQSKIDEHVTLYLVAVLEYISADILKLAGNYVKNIRHVTITCQDVKVAMCADKVLMDVFEQDNVLMPFQEEEPDEKKVCSYDEVVRNLIRDEIMYLRDLQMIMKVFRDILQRENIGTPKEIDLIFSNITDIMELTVTFISSLEDTMEMTEKENIPAIGTCFEELAEAEEFDVYIKYATDVLSPVCRKTLEALLPKQVASEALRSCGKGFREAVKFYLPKLLLGPIYHCFHYFNDIELLKKVIPSREECDTLDQVTAMLTPLKNKLMQLVQEAGSAAKRMPGDYSYRGGSGQSQSSVQRSRQLKQVIVNWDEDDKHLNSSHLVLEGKLKVMDNRRRLVDRSTFVDRYVFLCENIIIICKQITGKRGSASSYQGEYRMREKHLIRQVDILDREDTETEKYTFELVPRDQPKIVFKAEDEEEKNWWMALLVMLNTRYMLERLLNVILANEEKKHPLRFPPKDHYPFSEENSSENIIFEQKAVASGMPVIKGATLIKLVEYLTYHGCVGAEPPIMFILAFLTTYRSFSSPQELLDLLILRFNIPEPEFLCGSDSDSEASTSTGGKSGSTSSCANLVEKTNKIKMAQDLKKFRTEFQQPVQLRVLNVLKKWVNMHFYDFEQDEVLLSKLMAFLNGISCRSLRKWVDSIIKIVNRRLSHEDREKDIKIVMEQSPPPIESHKEHSEEGKSKLLTYHPIEIARQLTLLEFQYYCAVKPSELVDQAWTKEDKDKRSPNLLKLVRHNTNFTRFLEKQILETENLEERVAVMQRILEIMQVLQEYNNFNGVLAITSALNGSAVHRLSITKDKIPNNLLKALDEASSYVEDHFKAYWEKLRSINPPCVPFFGQYQTNILFLEEGNPDFLHNTKLINFSKYRKVAEIISEIQQYQNQPYCLSVYPPLKKFLESIDPFPDKTDKEITDYLWSKSIEIEPKNPGLKKKHS